MKTKLVTYEDQDAILEGFLAYDSKSEMKSPGVILCHAWSGRDAFVCEKAKEIAQWGYTVFALDLYGKGVLGKNKEENIALMTPFIMDRNFLRKRLNSSLDAFRQHAEVDNQKIAVLGFCFGGLCALDFARSGADVKGVVSIHGLLVPAKKIKSQPIKAKVLALHGYDDPMVPPKEVLSFAQEMTKAKADWQVHMYGNTMHAFTNPSANDPSLGTLYNPTADKRAWQLIRSFLAECFT